LSALIGLRRFCSTEEVLRRMAGTAMAEALDKVGAAVPFGRLLRVGLEFAGREEKAVPSDHREAVIERPRELVLPGMGTNRLKSPQIGPYVVHVLARDLGEPRIGERRIQAIAIRVLALVHGA